ncbi:MAG TPA: glycosyltransferase family 87 protein [Candidatus Rubrimentiphilum sp.]|nr:glycosyltransferase family 87 protein [Candidatus Rubrimentiphilum sp.]
MRRVIVVAAALAILTAFTVARPQHGFGPSLRDFEAYYSAGATWAHGDDAYSVAIWQTEEALPGVNAERFEVLPFVGPPATLPLWAAFSFMPYTIAANLWRVLLFVSLAGLLWILARLAGLERTPLVLFGLAVAALGFGPITADLALGQLALPVTLAVLCTFAANGALARGCAAVLAFAQPNLALALTGGLRAKKTALPIAIGAAAFVTVCFVVVRGTGIVNYIRVLYEHGDAERFSAVQLTPAAIAYGFGASENAALYVGVFIALVAVIVWLSCARTVRDPLMLFCATSALVPFVVTFFHEHDLVIVFAPALILAARTSGKTSRVALGGALLCAPNWLGLAQNPDSMLQTLLLVVAFAAVLVALRQDFSFRTLQIPAAVLILIGIAGLAARAHVLPVWPDAMAALPGGMEHAKIAAVWHAEQTATGLFARDSLWAMLRCASLAGCGLLAYAAVLDSVSSRSPVDSRTYSAARG